MSIVRRQLRPWILIAAYDVSIGESSEGYVAFNVLRRLAQNYRIILFTRINNQQRLLAQTAFRSACPGLHIVGFDLPRWASWWKRGARFYELYAYLWQLIWPLVIKQRKYLCDAVGLVHVLNFHNDSIPSSAWIIGKPVVWGPISHHEIVECWRRTFWPAATSIKHQSNFFIRCIAWWFDPLLWLTKRRVATIFSAGPWVDNRLRLEVEKKTIRLSQLGVDSDDFRALPANCSAYGGSDDKPKLLVAAGRLDWLKGLDVAIEALAQLPSDFRLLVVGKGPADTRLKQLVQRLGLDARVEFRSQLPRTELVQIYAACDLFLFPSPEVAGLAWIEALACGLPVVGFAGATEIALVGATLPGVYLAPPCATRGNNIANYAAVICKAAHEKHDRQAISAAALSRYGWERMVEVIEAGYAQALREGCQ